MSPHWSIYSSVFLLSACALAYEILLMRLFSIIQWHHFAYMVIGLALLGYGISGSVISIWQTALLRFFDWLLPLLMLLFAFTSVAVFLLGQHIPFNAEVILWDNLQWLYLLGLFLLLSIPFFFASSAICLTLMCFPLNTAQIYAADLIGAGVGSLGIVGLLFWVFPQHVLLMIAFLSLMAAGFLLPRLISSVKYLLAAAIGIGLIVLYSLVDNIALQVSPYKSLSQTLRISGAEVVAQQSGPLGFLTVLKNDSVPFRIAPGLSLNAQAEPLAQLALFSDADNMTPITRFPQSIEQLSYLDQMTSALPYHLQQLDSVLVVGGAGGSDVLQSLYHRVESIHVLELNPQLSELVDEKFSSWSGGLYSRPEVTLYNREVRDFLSESNQRYALIQMSLLDAFNAQSSGLHALHENYLYTSESIQLYLRHLQADGYLALTRWITIPPRDTLKLLNTVIQALQESGVQDAADRLLLIRGWQTATLLVKKGIFNADELQRVRQFCMSRSFDLAWLPDIKSSETNRYNKLSSALFYQASQKLLSAQRQDFVDNYKFNLTAASDNRPYFFHFFKWQTFRELFELRHQGGMPLMEWGYIILLATLLVAALCSLVLIVTPLLFIRRMSVVQPTIRRRDVIIFFAAIGLAFLMIEIAFIQKFVQLLHHPLYAIVTTLSAFLVFAGLGSQFTRYLSANRGIGQVLMFSIIGILLSGTIYLLMLDFVFGLLSSQHLLIRVLISIVMIAPLAFLMGMPFPLALSSLTTDADHYIPWAWAINGCASVISASLATIVAINYGFNAVVLLALLLYLLASLFFPSSNRKDRVAVLLSRNSYKILYRWFKTHLTLQEVFHFQRLQNLKWPWPVCV